MLSFNLTRNSHVFFSIVFNWFALVLCVDRCESHSKNCQLSEWFAKCLLFSSLVTQIKRTCREELDSRYDAPIHLIFHTNTCDALRMRKIVCGTVSTAANTICISCKTKTAVVLVQLCSAVHCCTWMASAQFTHFLPFVG